MINPTVYPKNDSKACSTDWSAEARHAFPSFLNHLIARHHPLVVRLNRYLQITDWAGNAEHYGFDFEADNDYLSFFPFLYGWCGKTEIILPFYRTPSGIIAELTVNTFSRDGHTEIWCYDVQHHHEQLQAQQQRGHELEILRYRHTQTVEKLRQEQAEILRLHHAQNELMARLAHEFRSPLVTMQYWTKHWQNDKIGQAPSSEYTAEARQIESLEVFSRNISHLLELVENLLTQGQQSSQQRVLKLQWISVNELLENLHSLLQVRALKTRHELCFMVADSVGESIWADGLALRQILTNLLSNAIQYSQSGKIELRIHYTLNDNQQRCLECQVIDAGNGISVELEKNLFQAFRRGENNQHSGSGLGLHISKQLAEQMHGNLFLRQARPYCEFVVQLPANNPLARLHNKKILLIEDDADIAALMQWVFGDLGLQTVHAMTLEAAEAILLTEQFDAILLDGQLPDGLATDWLTRQASHSFAHLPVLVVSAVREKTFIDSIATFPNAKFVPKGLAWEEVLHLLVNLMEKCGAKF